LIIRQGLSNIAGGFFSGYVVTGSFNRSGLNCQAGAKLPLIAFFAGLLLMRIVVLVAPLAAEYGDGRYPVSCRLGADLLPRDPAYIERQSPGNGDYGRDFLWRPVPGSGTSDIHGRYTVPDYIPGTCVQATYVTRTPVCPSAVWCL
jgi:hypothetical protein